jgi:hypothetical protein
MTLNSRSLAVTLFVVLFGGIAFSSFMGWWVTESTKEPITFTEGEFAGQANPADIRGSYTFGDISKSFDVTPETLAQAFGIADENPSTFAIKELETIYLDSDFEIGTASVRLFVADYVGLPFDTTDQEIYMPQSAADLLLARGNLTPDQVAYLEKYTVKVGVSPLLQQPVEDPVSTEGSSGSSEEFTVKGKTTFGELIALGVPQSAIEDLIDAPMPDVAMTLKDYAAANGLDFETLKPELQAEVDKIRP